MNKAFAEEQNTVSGMDTSSRHLLGQRQDVTAAPWNVAQAGHKVRLLDLAWCDLHSLLCTSLMKRTLS